MSTPGKLGNWRSTANLEQHDINALEEDVLFHSPLYEANTASNLQQPLFGRLPKQANTPCIVNCQRAEADAELLKA